MRHTSSSVIALAKAASFLKLETLLELAQPRHNFAHLAFDTAQMHPEERVRREFFDGLPFDASIPQVPREILACVRTRPPMAEIQFLRASGRYVGPRTEGTGAESGHASDSR